MRAVYRGPWLNLFGFFFRDAFDGARAALQDDLAAADLRGHAVPIGVGLAIGLQDRRA